jgi:ATP-dependent RNA helicase HelY
LHCERGDFAEYARLRREVSDREAVLARERAGRRRAEVVASLEKLRPGDVIRVPGGRRAGLAAVLETGLGSQEDPRPLVVTEQRWAGRLSVSDFPVPVEVLGRVRVSRSANHRVPAVRRDMAARIGALGLPGAPPRIRRGDRSAVAADERLQRLRAALRAHPCHSCPEREEHARWGERLTRLERENADLRRRIEGRTGSLGRRFDRICSLLEHRGYLDGDRATPPGRQLARIWSEADLLVAECLRAGVWDALAPAELAAVVSSTVYEARREQILVERMPTARVGAAIDTTHRVWAELSAAESELGLPPSREPELGFVWSSYRWARGEPLVAALDAAERSGAQLSVGDFIRWCKQLLDLLDQLAGPAGAGGSFPVAGTARVAASLVRRGVVAQSMQA